MGNGESPKKGTIPTTVVVLDEEGNVISVANPFSVTVIESALPSGAATAARQASILAELQEKLEAGQTIKSIITDGDVEAQVDKFGYLVSIEIEHHKVHEGTFYTVADFDIAVATVSPKYWHIITPDTAVLAHIKIQISTDTGGLIELFENPTTTDNGDALAPSNNDRNSTNESIFAFYKDPTVSDDGTRIEVSRIGAGREKKFGGEARQFSEIILKQDEQYLVKATPDANDAQVSLNVGFYEVTE